MILIYLLLGHFIADFLLQPNDLVAWKNKSWKGVLMHSSIHFLTCSILLYLYLPTATVLLASGFVAVCHFFIDSAKAAHQRRVKHSMSAYWVDQICHYASMILAYLLFGKLILSSLVPFSAVGIFAPFLNLYSNPAVLVFLILAIFSTFTIEYSDYKDRHKPLKKSGAASASPLDYKAMIKRLFVVSLIYIGLLFMFPAYISALGVA